MEYSQLPHDPHDNSHQTVAAAAAGCSRRRLGVGWAFAAGTNAHEASKAAATIKTITGGRTLGE